MEDVQLQRIIDRLDRIIELLSGGPKRSRDDIMRMNASVFISEYMPQFTRRHQVIHRAPEATVRDLYSGGIKIRNIGKKSIDLFRGRVEEVCNA